MRTAQFRRRIPWRRVAGAGTGALIVIALAAYVPTGFGGRQFVPRWSVPVFGGEPIVAFREIDGSPSDTQTPLFQRWIKATPQHVELWSNRGQTAFDENTDCFGGYRPPGTMAWTAHCRKEQGHAVDPSPWHLAYFDADFRWASVYAGPSAVLVAAETPGLYMPRSRKFGPGWLAAGLEDGAVLRWKTSGADFAPLPALRVSSAVTALQYFGRSALASGDESGTIHVWRDGGQPLAFERAHAGAVYALAFSRDGKLASAGADGRLILWDLGTGKKAQERAAHAGPIYQLVRTRDGRYVTGGYDGFLRVWSADGVTLQYERRQHYGPIYLLRDGGNADPSKGPSVVSAGWDGTARRWFYDKQLQTVRSYYGAVGASEDPIYSTLAVTADAASIAISQNGRIHVWPLSRSSDPTWPEVPRLTIEAASTIEERPTGMAFSTNGRWLHFFAAGKETWAKVDGSDTAHPANGQLVSHDRQRFVVWPKNPGFRSSIMVRDGWSTIEMRGIFSDGAYIPARSWSDLLLGRINIALADSEGNTSVGYLQPAAPAALVLTAILLIMCLAALLFTWSRRAFRRALV